ncbi:MAG: tetrahydrofolate dehydrogenase/cyclohydrolase catalytic domain-containing protein [Dehalococcoidales bacterium]|nr:tetrahydrofolate dehydrogenase/cyclohydrolase catalytic domain-containing protein [Dehalococcoidales bacterium]
MTARIINGQEIAARIREELIPRVEKLGEKGVCPGLAVVLVGEDPASLSYLRGIARGCEKVGIFTETVGLPPDVTHGKLAARVKELNNDARFHGIIIQRPLPGQIDESAILKLLAVEKDVDCLNPVSMAGLMTREAGFFAPCTPSAVIEMLDRCGVEIEGKRAVIVGGAGGIGRATGIMLLNRWATVIMCDYKTLDPAAEYRRAEILVSAVGRARMIRKDMVGPGAVVIDVGVSVAEDGKLSGDVDFDPVSQVAGMITPVPGGVGAVTTTILLAHTVEAAEGLSK